MQKWQAQKLRLRDDHTWKAPSGYKIVVIDRGAVRFNVPDGWYGEPQEGRFQLYDRKPPDDQCGIAVTVFNLPKGVDWTGLPLVPLLKDATEHKDPNRKPPEALPIDEQHGEVITLPREDIELVYRETRFIDPKELRPAYSRTVVARGFDVMCLFTFVLWLDDAEKLETVWQEFMRSIELGRYVSDPTRGDVLQ